jgi:hypothetical protein
VSVVIFHFLQLLTPGYFLKKIFPRTRVAPYFIFKKGEKFFFKNNQVFLTQKYVYRILDLIFHGENQDLKMVGPALLNKNVNFASYVFASHQ